MLRHPPFNTQAGLDDETLRPPIPALWSQSSVVCRGVMSWADQRVRAGEQVGALSRDAQAPPFNEQAVCAGESEGDTARASPDAAPSGGPLWRPSSRRLVRKGSSVANKG